jgi:hypothetical protein
LNDSRLPMGKNFNSHFGYIELPSEILEVGLFDTHIEFDCVDGVYHVYKCDKPFPLRIKKIFDKTARKN